MSQTQYDTEPGMNAGAGLSGEFGAAGSAGAGLSGEFGAAGSAGAGLSVEFGADGFEAAEARLKKQSENAMQMLYVSIGSLLCMLLTCMLGALIEFEAWRAISIVIFISLLIASVLIFFLAGKKSERAYTLCSLFNFAGIGLAVWLIMDLLDLEIEVLHLVMGVLPAAAIMAGVTVFYNSTGRESRKWALIGGIIVLGLGFILSMVMVFREATAFWVFTAVSSLLCTACIGAVIWANSTWESRSVLKGLAVASFMIFLLVVVIAIVLLILSSDSDSDSDGLDIGGRSSGGKNGSSKINAASRFASSGSSARRSGGYIHYYSDPTYFWHYTAASVASPTERMNDMNEEEQQRYIRKYRLRKALILTAVIIGAAAIIAAAVIVASL